MQLWVIHNDVFQQVVQEFNIIGLNTWFPNAATRHVGQIFSGRTAMCRRCWLISQKRLHENKYSRMRRVHEQRNQVEGLFVTCTCRVNHLTDTLKRPGVRIDPVARNTGYHRHSRHHGRPQPTTKTRARAWTISGCRVRTYLRTNALRTIRKHIEITLGTQ